MRILLTYTLVGRGGDALQVQAIADAFCNLGHEVTIVGATALAPYAFNTSGSRLRNLARRLPWWAKDLIELLAQGRLLHKVRGAFGNSRFDLVFHRGSIYDFVGARIAKTCPVIAHLDAPFGVERAFHGDGYLKRVHRRAMRSLGRTARLILTPSQAAKTYYTDMGVPVEKIMVMPNGVSTEQLTQARGLASNRFSFSSTPSVVGFIGSLSRWHRVDILLQAVHQLNATYPGLFRLRIVGRGEEYEKLQALARELGIEDFVEWVGAVPHEEIFSQISTFDIGVLPSTLNTGAPMKLFEYAAAACPMIGPDLANLRALFSEEEMRFFVPDEAGALTQAIVELSTHPDAACQLGLRAQERMKYYTWENILARVLKRFDAVA